MADEWHAPGATAWNNETRCAVDAAFLISRVLGAPRVAPVAWPGVPGARERALYYGENWRTPDGMQARMYQREGAAFLAERDYGILMDAPGLGKSSQALIAAETRLSFGVIPDPTTPVVLILCPALAKRHWKREVMKWTGHEAAILEGIRPAELPQCRYIIANYDILYGQRRSDPSGKIHDSDELVGWGKALRSRFLINIADELHVLRGKRSRRTTAASEVAHGVPVVWGLTGTLMPNYTRDLWSPLSYITGDLWGRYWDFAKKYCDAHQAQYGMVDKGSSFGEELMQRLAFFALGRTAESVRLELPPMQRERFPIDVEVSAPSRHEGARVLDRGAMVGNALRATARAKRPAVVEQTVEALNARQKVVTFLYMREQCDAVGKEVKHKIDCPVFVVHGDMSPEARDKMAITFRDAQAPAAFIATIDSVGMAISLVGANLVLFGDLVPEPWKMYQAELRCYRFDSKNSVLIRYLLATGTIDETYAETVIEKIETIQKTTGESADTAGISTVLAGKSSEEIVNALFEGLKLWGNAE